MSTMFNTIQIRYWLHLFFLLGRFIPSSAQLYTIWSDDCDTKDHWTGGTLTNSPNCDTEPKACIITSPSFGDLISDAITIPAYTGEATLYLRYGIKTFFGSSPDDKDTIVVSCSIDSGASWEHFRTYENDPVDISGDTVEIHEECQCVNCHIRFKFESTGTDATDMAYIDNFSLVAKVDGVIVPPILSSVSPTTTTTHTPTTNTPTQQTVTLTTRNPTTTLHTTFEPTTFEPTTFIPTTIQPTTTEPTTFEPTTFMPTTVTPTTITPTTRIPTTNIPSIQTTINVVTSYPTNTPTNDKQINIITTLFEKNDDESNITGTEND
eukprot:73535_1